MAYFYNKNERLPGLRQEVKGNLMLTAGIRDQQRKLRVSARVKRRCKGSNCLTKASINFQLILQVLIEAQYLTCSRRRSALAEVESWF